MIVDTENNRRSSYDNGLIFSEDDDLALFNELQSREHDDFLLKSEDDFENAFSTKLRYFSDYKLGVSIPCRGESNDLLNSDKDKDDYDWLLTPPDTPLFRSLDDETTSVNLIQRGRRPRSESISISRSSTMEKSYRSSRGSASPHRSTPSPQSRSSIIHSRGRPLSAPHSTPIVRHASPSRRASPPSSMPSTPAARSTSPTSRRLSTGSSSTASLSRPRDVSSVKTSRGNSASPKSSAWSSNIPGFSLDVPPNLRTSLADRPASYVRGSSPASRNSRDKYGRQSMSPTGSRSISSSHSQDRQQFCSSKGSVASSGDDDFDSLHSISMGGASFSKPRKLGTNAHSSSRTLVPKKPVGRIVPSSSAPKRSFDYAMRQMDRKTPQNMFRPLLSSVPSSTIYTEKASSSQSTLLFGNSSITTSSTASYHPGAGMTIDTEDSHNQDDMTSECGKALHLDINDEVFVLDDVDMSNEDNGHKLSDQSHNHNDGNINETPIFRPDQGESDSYSHYDATEVLQADWCHPRIDGPGLTLVCSKCSKEYFAAEQVESDAMFCPDCSRESETLVVTTPVSIGGVTEIPQIILRENYRDHKQSSNFNTMIGVPEYLEGVDIIKPKVTKHDENIYQGTAYYGEKSQSELSPTFVFVEEDKLNQVNKQVIGRPTSDLTHNTLESDAGQLTHHCNAASSKADVVEGVGISVHLLNRSSSSKGLLVQGRNFTGSKVPYGNVPYTGDSTNSMRSSSWYHSLSASSSFDLSSLRGTDAHMQCQPSRKKSDMDNNWDGVNSKAESTESSSSTASQHANQAIATANSRPKVNSESTLGKGEDAAVDERPGVYQNHMPSLEHSEIVDMNTSYTENMPTSKIMGVSSKDHSSICIQKDIDSIESFPCSVDNVSRKNDSDLTVKDTEASFSATLNSSLGEEQTISSIIAYEVDVAAVSTFNSAETMSEIEIPSVCQDSRIVSDLGSHHAETEVNDSSAMKLASSCSDLSIFNTDDILLGNGQNCIEARSWTLEKATDTVLLCSSIVHNLAYHAATIAIEKEEEDSTPYEPLRPTFIMQEKPKPSRKNPSLKSVSKENVKSHKARQKQEETETGKPYLSKIESDIKHREPLMQNVGLPKAHHMKPPKLESKCNCTIM